MGWPTTLAHGSSTGGIRVGSETPARVLEVRWFSLREVAAILIRLMQQRGIRSSSESSLRRWSHQVYANTRWRLHVWRGIHWPPLRPYLF